MKNNSKLITPEQALKLVLESATSFNIKTETVEVKQALNRILAENIHAKSPYPPADNSSMDGYCLNHILLKDAGKDTPVKLPLYKDIDAGHIIDKLPHGYCTYIATGAVIPDNADTVVKLEDVHDTTDNFVKFVKPAPCGQYIRKLGKEFNAGDLLIKKGEVLTPSKIGLICSAGYTNVVVFKKAVVAVLTSGDELIMPYENPKPWQIRNANTSMLCAMVQDAGASPIDMGIARDTGNHAVELLTRALHIADIVVTSGGISMGKKDPFKQAFKQLNIQTKFYKVKQKPGQPMYFGYFKDTPVFGLPGNQVSSGVSFELYVRPFIKKSMSSNPFRLSVNLPLAEDTTNNTNRDFFKRGKIITLNNQNYLQPLSSQESHMLTSLTEAELLFKHPADQQILPKNTIVKCTLLGT